MSKMLKAKHSRQSDGNNPPLNTLTNSCRKIQRKIDDCLIFSEPQDVFLFNQIQ